MRTMTLAAAAAVALSACAGTTPHLADTLNDADRDRLSAAHYYAFRGTLSQQSVWSNVATDLGGTVRALREYSDPDTGLPCRKVIEHMRSTTGSRDIRIGTACQKPDGDLLVVYSDRTDIEGEE
jgi:surface antigen